MCSLFSLFLSATSYCFSHLIDSRIPKCERSGNDDGDRYSSKKHEEPSEIIVGDDTRGFVEEEEEEEDDDGKVEEREDET